MCKILYSVLDYAIKSKASDIHITEGKPITFRVNGELKIMEKSGNIDYENIKKILEELLNNNEVTINNFYNNHDLDFAYIYKNSVSFRVNAYYKLGKISFALRKIADEAMKLEELGLPKAVEFFTKLKQGLVLITGPTGSGKSTSMVSILEKINESRSEHILTIEDPIEFIFSDKKSIFSQREVGRDTASFTMALRAAMREDSDIVMVGELRDKETVHAALELAETGQLVISTLHTSSAVQTVGRLLSFFPLDGQNAIRDKLADSLKGVLSQRLVPKIGGGRVGIFELMFMTSGIKNLIRTGITNQIQGNIETGNRSGMITMKKYADELRDNGVIKEEDYIFYFKEDDE